MPSNNHYAHQKRRLSKRQDRLQNHYDLLFDKRLSLQESLIFEVDPSIRYKLQHEIKMTQKELEQVQSQLQQVLLELDRLDQLLNSPLPKKTSSPPPFSPPIEQRTKTQLSSPPKRKSYAATSIPIESSIFVLLMVGIWLAVGFSSVKLVNPWASKLFLGLPQGDIVPGLPGAFGGFISGLVSALAWINSTRCRDQTQTILMGMGVGMISGAFVWATIFRVFVYKSPDQNLICGAIFGLGVGIAVLLWSDLRRTKL
jgi:hypothetical protein